MKRIIWSGIFSDWKKIPVPAKGFLLFILIVHVVTALFLSPPWTGDEASLYVTHVRYNSVFATGFLSNHPLYLGMASVLDKLGMSAEWSMRLPSLTGSLLLIFFLGWMLIRGNGFSIATVLPLAVLALHPVWSSYAFTGKSYVLASAFLLLGWYSWKQAERNIGAALFFFLAIATCTGAWLMVFGMVAEELFFGKNRKGSVWVIGGCLLAAFMWLLSWYKTGGGYLNDGVIGNFARTGFADYPQEIMQFFWRIFIQLSPVLLDQKFASIAALSGFLFFVFPVLAGWLKKQESPELFSVYRVMLFSVVPVLLTGYFAPERFLLCWIPLVVLAWSFILPESRSNLLAFAAIWIPFLFLVPGWLSFRKAKARLNAGNEIRKEAAVILLTLRKGNEPVWFHDWDEEGLMSYYFLQAGGNPHGFGCSADPHKGLNFFSVTIDSPDAQVLWSSEGFHWVRVE